MTTVLAVDQGTSGTKAIVHDSVDGVLAVAEVPVQPHYGSAGAVEVDPEQLLDSVLVAGRRALSAAGRSVDGFSLANQGETVMLWDPASGRPLAPALVWQDRRAATVVTGLREHAGLIAERTGLTLDPYFSAPKQTWLRRQHGPDGVVTTTDTWLLHRLCGAFVTDASTAGRSLLTRLDDAQWDDELYDLFELGDEPRPEIVAADHIVGETTAFGPGVPVGGLLVDQQAALLGQRCLEAGAAKCTFGTGAFLLAQCGGEPRRSATGLTASVAWRLRDRLDYCLDGQVYAAGSAIRWLQRLGLIERPADVDHRSAADPTTVLAVPALAGLAAPWWRSDATGTFTGLTLDTEPGHLVRAVVDGIAAQIAELVDAVAADLGRPMLQLKADGGLTQSSALMQAVADLAQLPVEVYPAEHATALGVALAGRLALEPDLSVADAVPVQAPGRVFEPRWPADRAASFRARWRHAAEQVLPR